MLSTPNRGKVSALGAELEYQWFGAAESGRPTIVMLHEGLGSLAMWKDFPSRLAERTGCPVLAYSRAGYGTSDAAALPRQPDYMHDEGEAVLPALLDALAIERPILFGHSDGGSIALLFAGRYPDRVRALVLEAPHVFVEPLTVASIAEAKIAYRDTDLPAKLGRYHADVDAAFWGWNDIWLDSRFLHWNIEASLPHIICPILAIQGRDDQYGTAAQLDAIASQTPATEVLLLDHCGHSPHRDQPEATLSAVSAFLDHVLERLPS